MAKASMTRRQILHQAECDFFLRFEQLLEQHGFLREPSQTQQEFSIAIGQELSQRITGFSSQRLLNRMVETYYRVRFGGHPLDEEQQLLVGREIDQLATVLAPDSMA